jgi:hypothetical protein
MLRFGKNTLKPITERFISVGLQQKELKVTAISKKEKSEGRVLNFYSRKCPNV